MPVEADGARVWLLSKEVRNGGAPAFFLECS